MEASILCELLAQRIPPEQFNIMGGTVRWTEKDFDTSANVAIVDDVIANYDVLAEAHMRDQHMAALRSARNRRLDEADLKYVNAEKWEAMTADQRLAWRVYKQALRDLPATVVDPEHPVWPEMPL